MSSGPSTGPRPVATYRLQLHAGFTFDDAAAVVPYLVDLGISHLYLSPILQAVPGSTHGYDQCDPGRVSDELGGEDGFRHLSSVARAHGLGIVLDIVPNHMATSETNPWWWELLRSGRDGRAGPYFDVDWDPPQEQLRGRVLAPVLDRSVGEALAGGEFSVVERDGQRVLAYHDQHFPLADPAEVAVGDQVTQELLDRQHYLLACWRDASQSLNYRRFFDINSLIALREEDRAVFAAMHALPLQLVQDGDAQGLRVDHVDGLRDPGGYLDALRRSVPGAWLLVEKILEPGERLPSDWPVEGTTGYEFIPDMLGVFIDPSAEESLTRFYGDFTGELSNWADAVRIGKLEAARRLFVPDVSRLERWLEVVCRENGVDVSREARIEVINHVAANLDVYRTYAAAGTPMAAEDRARIDAAVEAALSSRPPLPRSLLGLVRSTLLLTVDGEAATEFALRFQQFSGPLMAKGVEDTALYRFNRMVCLNEVGGDPGRFGVPTREFHAANQARAVRNPMGMLASSTHDTKRSEDVRARLSLLAQLPDQWIAAVRRWAAMNEPLRRGGLPDRNAEYLLYQTLLGAWPLTEDRAAAYMEKAAREARNHTSWTDPNPGYEGALRVFVSGVMAHREFQADLAAFVEPLVDPGRAVSMAQLLFKLTSPGIPDIYQGTELWDLSLVDPDNRRPVDYARRRELMLQVEGKAIMPAGDVGVVKLQLVTRALAARRRSAEAFGPGSIYTPLEASGPGAAHIVAYARGTSRDPLMVVVVVPRLTLRSSPDWSRTTLSLGPGAWRDTLWSGNRIDGPGMRISEVFERHPLSLLERLP